MRVPLAPFVEMSTAAQQIQMKQQNNGAEIRPRLNPRTTSSKQRSRVWRLAGKFKCRHATHSRIGSKQRSGMRLFGQRIGVDAKAAM